MLSGSDGSEAGESGLAEFVRGVARAEVSVTDGVSAFASLGVTDDGVAAGGDEASLWLT
jgi:hypothetical protein